MFAVHLEQPNADGDTLSEKPFRPCNRLFSRCGLAFQGDYPATPSLAPCELVRTVDAQGVGIKCRFGACDGFEGADGTFPAQDCASIRKELGEILVLTLVVDVCPSEVVPAMEISVAIMILGMRIKNWSPKALEYGRAAPSSWRWIAGSPECGCSWPNSRWRSSIEWWDVRGRRKETATRGFVRNR